MPRHLYRDFKIHRDTEVERPLTGAGERTTFHWIRERLGRLLSRWRASVPRNQTRMEILQSRLDNESLSAGSGLAPRSKLASPSRLAESEAQESPRPVPPVVWVFTKNTSNCHEPGQLELNTQTKEAAPCSLTSPDFAPPSKVRIGANRIAPHSSSLSPTWPDETTNAALSSTWAKATGAARRIKALFQPDPVAPSRATLALSRFASLLACPFVSKRADPSSTTLDQSKSRKCIKAESTEPAPRDTQAEPRVRVGDETGARSSLSRVMPPDHVQSTHASTSVAVAPLVPARSNRSLRGRDRGERGNFVSRENSALTVMTILTAFLVYLAPKRSVSEHEAAGQPKQGDEPPQSINEVSRNHHDDAPPDLRNDPTYGRYFKMLKIGMPIEVVRHALTRDGFDPLVMDAVAGKSMHMGTEQSRADNRDHVGLPALKNDPIYKRYFKMLKIGMPVEVVKHAMIRDGLDPSVMDGDRNEPPYVGTVAATARDEPSDSINDASPNTGTRDEVGPPALKDDPTYEKYFRMLKIGMPMEVVKHAMIRDGRNPSAIDGNPGKPAHVGTEPSMMGVDSGETSPNTDSGDKADPPALENDPTYRKYFKMLKIGMSMEVVKHAMTRDGLDASVMDGDHNKPARGGAAQSSIGAAPFESAYTSDIHNDADPPALIDDPAYEKYFKMLKIGTPWKW
jgi:Subunit CCDC53 of WASH complex